MDRRVTFKALGVFGGRELVLSSEEFASYIIGEFPWELNELCRQDTLFANLYFQIDHLRHIQRVVGDRAVVHNALIATWPGKLHSQVAVVEFMSIQNRLQVEPDLRPMKKRLLSLIFETWGVFFEGKELKCNNTLLAAG